MLNAFDTEKLVVVLRQNMGLYAALHEHFVARRDRARELLEGAQGEVAVVMRGRCQELTAVINELFKEVPR